MTRLGSTDLDVFPLCLGGNVFGWTADEATSFAILDRYRDAGGNFVDTANSYSAWVRGNQGGESEAILGRWMKARGVRDEILVATKVGSPLHDQPAGLGRDAIRKGATDSLTRLQTDRIDLYYAHIDDESTPLEESLGAFSELVDEGLVQAVGVSNFGPERLREAVEITQRDGLAAISALQPHYNLVEREFEDGLEAVVADSGVATMPYYALANGFLAGAYRPGGDTPAGPRADRARKYLDDRGQAVLQRLDSIAAAHETTVAAVSLAWLKQRPTVLAPIASARTTKQLAELIPMAQLTLTDAEIAALDEAATR
jgi:aryl-alcohol dehydrogenase-like predicted oxidoreductase